MPPNIPTPLPVTFFRGLSNIFNGVLATVLNTTRALVDTNASNIDDLQGVTTGDDLGVLVGSVRTVLPGKYRIDVDVALGFEQLLITGDVEFIGSGTISANATTGVGPMVLITGGSLKCRGITLHNTSTGTGGTVIMRLTGSNAITLDLVDTTLLIGDFSGNQGLDIESTGLNDIDIHGCTIHGNQAFRTGGNDTGTRLSVSDTTFNSRAVAGARCCSITANYEYVNFINCVFNLGEFTFNIQPSTYTNPVRILGCTMLGFTSAVFNGLDQTSGDVETLFNNGVADG